MGGGRQRGDEAAGAAAAWLSTLLYEALDKVATPAARNALVKAALAEAGADALPSEPGDLLRFAVGPLRDWVASVLGEQAGEALVQDVEPILQQAAAAAAPAPAADEPAEQPAEAAQAHVVEDPADRRLAHTLPQRLRLRDDGSGPRLEPATSPGPVAAPATKGKRRTTFPYLAAVLQQANARLAVVVDDERAYLAGWNGALRERGFQVFTAPDRDSVVALCRRINPECVVASSAMPELDGERLAERVRAAMAEQAPLVVLLGERLPSEPGAEGVLTLAADELEPAELVGAVAAELERRRG